MIQDAIGAFFQTFSPPLRKILLKSIGLALLLLVALGGALQWLLQFLLPLSYPYDYIAAILLGLLTLVVAFFAMAPVTSLMAAIFLDDVAEEVERTKFPADAPGTPLSVPRSMALSVKFFGVVLLVNLAAILLWFVIPVFNVAVFFIANAYLLSREFFELAAMRFRTPEEARLLRRQHAAPVFVSGLIIAAIVIVPVLNLITPVFATAFMVRRHKRLMPMRELLPPERSAS
ncbi:MAG TPA: sulfate transporter family protein [Xanthobacteraceae bacterium]|nr:sulfate transporter family protein [Xanthobacteraceae bacterium]